MKVVINACFGGFGISDAAYEKLIEWGIPVRGYVEERDPETKLFKTQPSEVIFDRKLSQEGEMFSLMGRYWENWLRENRSHPLLIRVVEELGDAANGRFAVLRIVEIPNNVEWEIDEYDGNEHVAEKHRIWR